MRILRAEQNTVRSFVLEICAKNGTSFDIGMIAGPIDVPVPRGASAFFALTRTVPAQNEAR